MKVNLTGLLKKRLNKLDSNFKHYDDDMAFLTLTSRNDGALKDLLGIQLLRNAGNKTIARDIARLDLAVLDDNTLSDIIKLKSVYVQDFEENPTVAEAHAVKLIKRDIEDNLNKILNPPKSWTYAVAEDARLHFAGIYIDVQADQNFELPETQSGFLKLYPELKEGNLIYKSILRHQEARDYSIEEIIEPRLLSAVINPVLENHDDIYVKKGDIETLYSGTYKEFTVRAYFQTFEIGQGPEPEDVEIEEDVVETVDFEPSEVEATIEVDEIIKEKKAAMNAQAAVEAEDKENKALDENETKKAEHQKDKKDKKEKDAKKDKKQTKKDNEKKDNKKSKKKDKQKSEKSESKKDKKKETANKKKDKDDKDKKGKKKKDKKDKKNKKK